MHATHVYSYSTTTTHNKVTADPSIHMVTGSLVSILGDSGQEAKGISPLQGTIDTDN